MIYTSTDSVFNGRKNGLYNEDDEPDLPNVYGRTKREGEVTALAAPGGTVLRTNIFGWSRAERLSFVEWVMKALIERTRLAMFADVKYTPIHVSHVAEVVSKVLAAKVSRLFHATGSSVLSKYDFPLQMAATALDTGSIARRDADPNQENRLERPCPSLVFRERSRTNARPGSFPGVS